MLGLKDDIYVGGGINPEAVRDARAPVSVLIPCFCCSTSISRALESVIAQTLLPVEVILVEDASPDGGETLRLLRILVERYGDVVDIKLIALKENVGAGSARNCGLENATQPYIAFLDADDAWHPQKIEYQLGWMLQNPTYGLVGHAHMRCDVSKPEWPILSAGELVFPVSKIKTLLSNPFATPTVMLKRELSFRFKEGMRYSEDYLLWLQIILADTPTAYMNLPLAATFKNDYGESGLSANLWQMEKGELDCYRQIMQEGRIGIIQYSFLYVFSFAKYLRRRFLG